MLEIRASKVRYVRKKGFLDYLFYIVSVTVITAFAMVCIYPFWYVLIYSLSDAKQVISGLSFYPKGFTLENYALILSMNRVGNAVLVSASRAVVGTAVTLFFSSMYAYVLTKGIKGRLFLYRMMVVTMYVGAGLIPYILVMRLYGLKDSYLLYILPGAVAPYYVILIKTYIEQLPVTVEEAALIDGASYFQVYRRLIMPMSLPVLAAVGVFSAVGQWNSWTDNFYLVSDPKLQTLQLLLLDILRQSEALARAFQQEQNYDMIKNATISPMTVRMTITIVSVLPIFIVYPLLQRYFVKGILMGAIKG